MISVSPNDVIGVSSRTSTDKEESNAAAFHKVRSFDSSEALAPWALISCSTSINERPLDFALFI